MMEKRSHKRKSSVGKYLGAILANISKNPSDRYIDIQVFSNCCEQAMQTFKISASWAFCVHYYHQEWSEFLFPSFLYSPRVVSWKELWILLDKRRCKRKNDGWRSRCVKISTHLIYFWIYRITPKCASKELVSKGEFQNNYRIHIYSTAFTLACSYPFTWSRWLSQSWPTDDFPSHWAIMLNSDAETAPAPLLEG